jgi:hypothetical protein
MNRMFKDSHNSVRVAIGYMRDVSPFKQEHPWRKILCAVWNWGK